MNPRLNLKTSTVTPLDLHAPSPEMEEKVEAVERIIKYEFKKKNKRLLEEALTHSSCANAVSNLRLAFMGDAVLGLAVSKYLYHEYPGIDQGDLTRLRSVNVGNEKFARVAVRHNLYNYLRRTAPDVDDLVNLILDLKRKIRFRI
jgi:dsRNA-specific ribonuclease